MKRAYLNLILDVSVPVPEDDVDALLALSKGICAAMALLERDPRLRLEVALAGTNSHALLRQGQQRPLRLLAEAASRGQVAFLSTAGYGAMLPLLPPGEAQRQLVLNNQLNWSALGEFVFRTEGLFPPWLAYSAALDHLALGPGSPNRIVVDDLAWAERFPRPDNRSFRLAGASGLHVFFCDRQLSGAIAAGKLDGVLGLARGLTWRRQLRYAVVRLPARLLTGAGPALGLLNALSTQRKVVPALLGELLALFPVYATVEPRASSVDSSPGELDQGIAFAPWFAPDNELQAILWRLATLAAQQARRLVETPDPLTPEVVFPDAGRQAGELSSSPLLRRLRLKLDRALDCAPWRCASTGPEFDPACVRAGAARLLSAIHAGGDAVEPSVRQESLELCHRLEERCDALTRQTAPAAAAGLT